MMTSPMLRLSSWPSPSTTTLATTPSSKWRCSGRKSFLKLSRTTRKTLPPNSLSHTCQRYSKICCWPAVTAFSRAILSCHLFLYALTLPPNSFLLSGLPLCIQRSLEDEINRTTAEDIPIFMISYAVIFVYIAVALGEYSSWKRILVRLQRWM